MRLAATSLVVTSIAAVATAVFLIIPAEAGARGRPVPEPPGQSIDLLAIDVDVSGNSPTSVGPVESCLSAPPGTLVTIDIVVDSIPVAAELQGGVLGFQFELRYKRRALSVVGIDNAQMLAANGGTTPIQIIDPLPDSDGAFFTIFVDFGEGTPEHGDGVLSRITLLKTSRAAAAIEIADPVIVDSSNRGYTFSEVRGARIVSREGCR